MPTAYSQNLEEDYYEERYESEEEEFEELIVEVDTYQPKVLTANLIEENNVPIYAHLVGVQSNPTVQISRINSVSVFPTNRSQYVLGVNYRFPYYKKPTMDDLGFLEILLKKIPKEAEVPDTIDIGLKARLYLDINRGFGLNVKSLILTEQKELDVQSNINQIFEHKGYVLAKTITDNKISLEVYDGFLKKIARFTLRENEISRPMRLYGLSSFFDDFFRIQLNKIVEPEDSATFMIEVDNDLQEKILNAHDIIYKNWELISLRKTKCKNSMVEEVDLLNGDNFEIKTLQVVRGPKEDVTECITEEVAFNKKKSEYYSEATKSFEKVIRDYPQSSYADDAQFALGSIYKDSNEGKRALDAYQNVLNYENIEPNIPGGIVPPELLFNKNIVDNKIKELKSDEEIVSSGSLEFADFEGHYVRISLVSVNEIKEFEKPAALIRVGKIGSFELKYVGDSITGDWKISDITSNDVKFSKSTRFIETLREGQESKNILFSNDKIFKKPLKVIKVDEGKITLIDPFSGDEIPKNLGGELTKKIESNRAISIKINKIIEKGNVVEFLIQDILEEKLPTDLSDLSKYVSAKVIEKGKSGELDGISVEVRDIKLRKQAYLTIIPGYGREYTESEFNIHIPVEKRLFNLTPEQIDNKINSTQAKIERLDKTIENLDKVISFWKKICFAAFATISIKNFILGGDRNIARREVMNDYYKKACNDKVNQKIKVGDYGYDYDDCVSEFSEEIERAVDCAEKGISATKKKDSAIFKDDNIAKYEELTGDKVYSLKDKQEFMYYQAIQNCEKNNKQGFFLNVNEQYTLRSGNFKDNQGFYSEMVSSLKEVKLDTYENSGYLNQGKTRAQFKQDQAGFIENKLEYLKLGIELEKIGVISVPAIYGFNSKTGIGEMRLGDGNKITYKKDGKKYIITSDEKGNYESGKTELKAEREFDGALRTDFAPGATAEYHQDGRPYCIPLKKGNFVKVDDYSESNAPLAISIWNVGGDGELCTNDDLLIHHWGEEAVAYSQRNSDVISEFRSARNAVQRAFGKIKDYDGFRISNGASSREYEGTKARCTDFMSIDDCKTMYLSCDSVLCPPSRFTLGGKVEERNVVQSGLIGSLVLGLPSNPPAVCVTGISAWLKTYRSYLQGYVECLREAKFSGKSVGICDRIRSIFICQMMWNEIINVFQLKGGLISFLTGKLIGRDGGEYGTFMSNWENTVDTVKYFTTEYASTAFAAYRGRSSQEIGTEICKSAIYGQLPAIGEFVDEIARPENPPQFFAFFDEIPYQDIKVPPESQYSVYYHIYAGDVYAGNVKYLREFKYSVFLEGPYGRFFVSEPRISRLGPGEYVDKNRDFIAQSGFDQICVDINGQIKCGFGKVSTEFGLDYLNDLYVSGQAQKQIKSEKECVPRNPQAFGVTLPGEFGLVQTGIVRVCSVANPGKGTTDEITWQIVGTCGEDKEGRSLGSCWLDTSRVKKILVERDVESKTLSSIQEISDSYFKEGVFLDETASENELEIVFELISKAEYDQAILKLEEIKELSVSTEAKAKAEYLKGVVFFLKGRGEVEKQEIGIIKKQETSIIKEIEPGIPEGEEELPPIGETPEELCGMKCTHKDLNCKRGFIPKNGNVCFCENYKGEVMLYELTDKGWCEEIEPGILEGEEELPPIGEIPPEKKTAEQEFKLVGRTWWSKYEGGWFTKVEEKNYYGVVEEINYGVSDVEFERCEGKYSLCERKVLGGMDVPASPCEGIGEKDKCLSKEFCWYLSPGYCNACPYMCSSFKTQNECEQGADPCKLDCGWKLTKIFGVGFGGDCISNVVIT